MHYQDIIHGKVTITEPIILKLISSSSLQRLKEIDVAGYWPFWKKKCRFGKITDHTRLAHSIGVFLLLRKFKAPLEEQVAGLIHDLSHTAFSHCIDYVLKEGSVTNHDHQDRIFEQFVRKTEVPKILKAYGFKPEKIIKIKDFPMLETELPDICADRLDYSLRTTALIGKLTKKEIKSLLSNLVVKNNQWLFKNYQKAFLYAKLYQELNTNYYASFDACWMFLTLSQYLKHALKNKYIKEQDFYTTDNKVLDKINKHLKTDQKLKLFFNKLNKKVKCINNPKNYDFVVPCKSRAVDPSFIKNGKIMKVSEINKNWQKVVATELKPKKYYLRYLTFDTV